MTPINGISIPPSLARGLESLRGIEGFEGIGNLSELENVNSSQESAPAFKEFLLDALDHVNSMQHDADHAVEQLATGEDVNAAEVLTAVQKADLSFRMMMQIRNKLMQAYQEIKEIRI
ncbi:MAG: flagellar hook-basal body complex protein FliE [Planctomycetaceae bacterium]|nr:flagellar hook-basal body complex protein FliE [Planctomycetales bacterium]MCB9924777.1 flagellar hook-basal body complex protein FliE [Planctomycetaceae bacterium]